MLYLQRVSFYFVVLVMLINLSCGLTTFGWPYHSNLRTMNRMLPLHAGSCIYVPVRELPSYNNLPSTFGYFHDMNISENFHIYRNGRSRFPYSRVNIFDDIYIETCVVCNNVTAERILVNKSSILSERFFHISYLMYVNTTIPTLNSTYLIQNNKSELSYAGLSMENVSMSNVDENFTLKNIRTPYNILFNINLNNNLLNYLPSKMLQNLSQIHLISLQHNKFVGLKQSLCGPEYNSIYMQNNLLTTMDTECQISVQFVNVSRNAIRKFVTKSLIKFRGILRLDLSHNQIDELVTQEENHEPIESLESLFLNNNKLTKLPRRIFRCFTNLLSLNLRDNLISSLHPEGLKDMTQLEQMDLSSNFISDIPYGFFKDCHSLRDLSLADNKIKTLSVNTFSGLHAIKVLNISHNYLTHFLEMDIMLNHGLLGLDVSNNLIRKMDLYQLIHTCGLKHVSYMNNLWNCADLLEMMKTGKQLYNVERGYFYEVPNIHGIPCSGRNITWPEGVTFEDFLSEISDEEDMERTLAHLSAIPEEDGKSSISSDNTVVENLLAFILAILVMDFIIKWACKVYRSKQALCASYDLLKSKSQHSVSTVVA